MGLDTVELVMAVEKEFGIAITDDDAGRIVTAGDLFDCVMNKLQNAASPWSHRDPAAAWQRLREVIAFQAGIEVGRVVKSAAIVDDLGMS